ncbi:MAG: hypothetical protein A3A51_01345 [Candidatus Levybacteria bacterium RIFCSPLOWO2_01_FULL_39_10]|nr:MAG: hypothetical protein A3A51_01345 [Candidatus Levybacteria bacterium RIFCSPLOWO2_01_FULL_39_10]
MATGPDLRFREPLVRRKASGPEGSQPRRFRTWKEVRYMAEMYCVKCRAKRDDPNAQPVTMKNGKPALKGKCPVCGTGMYRIGKA